MHNEDLKRWLESLGCQDVQLGSLCIQGGHWLAAKYKQTLQFTASMGACQWGERKPGDTYEIESIYVVGKLPSCYIKRARRNRWGTLITPNTVCYQFDGDTRDWYHSGYIIEIPPKFDASHPFGASFTLRPWDIKDSKVDDGLPVKYTRITAEFKPV